MTRYLKNPAMPEGYVFHQEVVDADGSYSRKYCDSLWIEGRLVLACCRVCGKEFAINPSCGYLKWDDASKEMFFLDSRSRFDVEDGPYTDFPRCPYCDTFDISSVKIVRKVDSWKVVLLLRTGLHPERRRIVEAPNSYSSRDEATARAYECIGSDGSKTVLIERLDKDVLAYEMVRTSDVEEALVVPSQYRKNHIWKLLSDEEDGK